MSKTFIENRIGSASLQLAKRQQEQIAYFTQSEIQAEFAQDYFEQWANRNYQADNHFLNWVKSVFRSDNFLSFFKYLRNPNPSSELINTRIKEPLKRVYYSEDSHFSYVVRGKEDENPLVLDDDFKERLFNEILFNHNAIVIHDLKDVNQPFRDILCIDKVVAIKQTRGVIKQIAYTATIIHQEQTVDGFAYMDDKEYAFYDKDYNLIVSEPHDLDFCPAHFLVDEPFAKDPIVKKSIFSHPKAKLEEYVFLKTLQRMTEANGVIPIISKIKTNTTTDEKKSSPNEPMSSNEIRGQQPEYQKQTAHTGSIMQPGTVIDVPVTRKADGSVDHELAANLINFFYLPVESMEYFSDRIEKVEQSIITSLLGDYSEANESAKNELQVSKSYVSKEDVLRGLSTCMSRIQYLSDYTMLSLAYGKDSVDVDVFYGSDFFLETQDMLLDMFAKSPNPVERRSILTRMSQTRNKFNETKQLRETILYKLIPFVSDKDFQDAKDRIDPVTFELQTRFNYWIALFEAEYGNIVSFWEATDVSESTKLIETTNILTGIINSNIQTNGTEKNRAS